ncbi:DUF397 domain-containing protein (plasmid) [Amycolatopsis sp. FU40]|uniref:DUF397 domain-containing protein n=1 Tax=Amycolatopsis sp. FU40 TaxID=2914159 RepID=UPI001F16F495|nr:DUF397 domain-containing protein [Amycolatopsis sp. FU40]UKD50725.1 DUF397 domain-containing protein [Amycolatopsis sp. FU40]
MNHPATPAFDPSRWRKSSASGSDGGCVEVNDSITGVVGLRDSKLGETSPVARFDRDQWATWQDEIRRHRLDGENGAVSVTEHSAGWDVRVSATGEILRFTGFEVECFQQGVNAGEFD